MEAGHRDELVQDAPLLGPPAVAVSLDDRRHEFIPRRHAHPPHRYLPDPIRVGSISDEATDQHSGTFLARQCVASRRLLPTMTATFTLFIQLPVRCDGARDVVSSFIAGSGFRRSQSSSGMRTTLSCSFGSVRAITATNSSSSLRL